MLHPPPLEQPVSATTEPSATMPNKLCVKPLAEPRTTITLIGQSPRGRVPSSVLPLEQAQPLERWSTSSSALATHLCGGMLVLSSRGIRVGSGSVTSMDGVTKWLM